MPLLENLKQNCRHGRICRRQGALIVYVVVDLMARDTGKHRDTFSRGRSKAVSSIPDGTFNVNAAGEISEFIEAHARPD
jgi:hypothetical protein